jgi:hypothetical protein
MMFNNVMDRSLLYVDGPLLVDDEGLHGMVEKCGQKLLTPGSHTVYIEGFQAGGGVGMEAKYSGPDTGGKMIFMRSGVTVDVGSNRVGGRYYSKCDPSTQEDVSQFSICIFRSEVSLNQIPSVGQADTGSNRLYFVGKGSVPYIDMRTLDQFRAIVPNTPDSNYMWAISGALKIEVAGMYTLCIESDDG